MARLSRGEGSHAATGSSCADELIQEAINARGPGAGCTIANRE